MRPQPFSMATPVLLLAMLVTAAPALAADVDGRWTGMMETPMGEVPIAFTFKAEGTTLTGSMTGMDGAEIPISDGKIDGDKIAYVVKLDFGGMPLELIYRGVVAASEIKLDLEVVGMTFQLVVTKAK